MPHDRERPIRLDLDASREEVKIALDVALQEVGRLAANLSDSCGSPLIQVAHSARSGAPAQGPPPTQNNVRENGSSVLDVFS